jgi:hypothetical protein
MQEQTGNQRGFDISDKVREIWRSRARVIGRSRSGVAGQGTVACLARVTAWDRGGVRFRNNSGSHN